jgi:hypothetical protein
VVNAGCLQRAEVKKRRKGAFLLHSAISVRIIHALFSFAQTPKKTLYSWGFSAKNGSEPAWILRYLP